VGGLGPHAGGEGFAGQGPKDRYLPESGDRLTA
jgi:hypothetical protein